MDRLAMLRQMVARTPGDPFAHYGLAMELRKAGQLKEAEQCFAGLVETHPQYVATYLMFGNLLRELGDVPGAARIYTQGVEVARAAADSHTMSELQAALAEIE